MKPVSPLPDLDLLEVYRTEAEEHLQAIRTGLIALKKDPNGRIALQDVRRRAHTLKAAAGFVGMTSIADLSHRLEDLLDWVDDGAQPITVEDLDMLFRGLETLEALNREADRESSREILPPVRAEKSILEPLAEEGFPPGHRTLTVRVLKSRLEHLTQLVAELLAGQSETAEDKPLTSEIKSCLLRMRMLPLQLLAPRLHRIVRVTAAHEKKEAILVLDDNEMEMDDAIVAQIVDPLMHLLRNSVVHGIEPPDVRRNLGKPAQGVIFLRASRESGDIVLKVEDDGAGLNLSAIRDQAIKRGLILPGDAHSIDESALHQFILVQGFSTAQSLNETSGRGIGMDVVREALRELNGSMSIQSEAGKGAAFTLRIPMPDPIQRAGVAEAEELNGNHAPTVMVVDDDPGMRQINAALIRDGGYRVTTANDGLDALACLERGKVPDAILLDLEMPRLNGIELLAVLRSREACRDTPIIMLTSHTSERYRKKAADLGISEYLTKPCAGDVLISHLRRLTNHEA